MKKIFESKNKGLIVLIVILMIFLLNTFLTFRAAINYATQNTEYKEARAYMASALVVNLRYIYPLTEAFGWDRAIIKPFYILRDKLFDIGYSKFPKDEGEKEFWWYSVKFKEFEDCASPRLIEWALNKEPSSYLNSKQDKFIELVDDLYNHIDTLASAKITKETDKTLAKQKLVEFIIIARRYQDSNTILKHKLARDHQAKLSPQEKFSILPPSDIKRYEHVYNTYISLLNSSKINEKESYGYFYSAPIHWLAGDLMAFNLVQDILLSNLYSNQLNCNDKYIKIFTDEHRKIRNFYLRNKKNRNINSSLLTDAANVAKNIDLLLAYKCQNNPYMKDYIQYCFFELEDRKRRWGNAFQPNNAKTIDELKNEIINDYKKNKDYGRLEQLKSIGIK